MALPKLSCLVLFVFVVSVTAAANSTCYYPNGVKNNGGACNANAEVSVCCGPTFVCLGNGLCQVGPDALRTYGYEFYRSGCTDASFNSPLCPQICTGSGNHTDRGQGVKKCGENTYCCGGSGDCCSDSTAIFTLGVANAFTTIHPSYASATASNSTSKNKGTLVKDDHALAIGLGVGIGAGGFLLIVLAALYVLKRRAKARAIAGYQKKEDISEMDASLRSEIPDALPTATKASYAAPGDGVIHEIADARNEVPIAPQELDANTTYDWEPRNEPQPRDGGFRPEQHTGHRPSRQTPHF